MKVFVFRCRVCGEFVETDTHEAKPTHCDQPMRRVFSLGGIAFKGPGFYTTDSRVNVHIGKPHNK